MKPIKINHKILSETSNCYIIAEIGSNHNGNFQLACDSIKAAKLAGADAAKFQTFKAKQCYSKYDNRDIYQLIESVELNRGWMKDLKKFADSIDIDFLTTPCDEEAIAQTVDLNLGVLKVSSFDMCDLQLLDLMVQTRLPIILSTGMASIKEIDTVVRFLKEKKTSFILLQCSSLYPAPSNISNLLSLKMMQDRFACFVGYSDHTIGDHIPIAAVAMGAKVVEKHFTLDKTFKGPDHSFAMEPYEFRNMVHRIREVECAIGNGKKSGPHTLELDSAKQRRSIHAKVAIKKGDVLTKENLIIKRPFTGLHPFEYESVIGKVATKDIYLDEPILSEHLKRG